MFKKLRNNFLLLNMASISIVMIVAFVAIYIIISNNVGRSNRDQLRTLSGFRNMPPFGDRMNLNQMQQRIPQEFAGSFTVDLDKDGNILRENSYFNIEKEYYEKAVALAWTNKHKKNGSVNSGGRVWAYEVRNMMGNYQIAFLDVTASRTLLKNMIYTFALVGTATLLVFFLISLFFANKSIKPINGAWEKQARFIADASHELRTPLAIIYTNTDLILSNENDTVGSQKKWLEYIKTETERMTGLTNELLYLAKVDYSDAEMMYSDFEMSVEAENVILSMEAIAYERGIGLVCDIEPGICVTGNGEQLKRVMVILLDNAIKYTKGVENGSVINIMLKKVKRSIFLTVRNTGEPIPPKDIDKIFDRFYRADKSRAHDNGGYGLGLPIAKTIAEQHGGDISVKSRDGFTEFTLTLNADPS